MKQSELEVGKAYSNGAKGKWLQARTITTIEDKEVHYKVTGGRDPERTGSMTKVGFAQWAEREVQG